MTARAAKPWHQNGSNLIDFGDGNVAILEFGKPGGGDWTDAERLVYSDRIVACVNACAGIPTSMLTASVRDDAVAATPRMILALRQHRDALIEALRDARPYVAGAYECAFPDEDQNREVLRQTDDLLPAVTP